MMPSPSPLSSVFGGLFKTGASAVTGDARLFLQRRVALYLKFQASFIGAFYILDATTGVLDRGASALFEQGMLAHLGLVLGLFCGWLFVRRGEKSSAILYAVDAAATLGLLGPLWVVLATIPKERLLLGPAFAVALTLVARAAIVPSSGLRSLVLGAAMAAIVSIAYVRREQPQQPLADFVLIWTSAFTLASSLVSRIIYGLQRQVREAQELGQYVLEEKLGEGGMGIVYRARHAMLRRPTAVKLLLPERAGEKNLQRFEREVRQTARLSHPNTVTIYDYGRTPDGVFYYAMELLDGADLDEVVAVAGAQCAARTVHVLSCVAGALAEAHEQGLIHRDIKPANIVLCRQGGIYDVPKVVDFGLVKELEGEPGLTGENVFQGTPLYMSPESITEPGRVDARSDLYALGAVGYHFLTGQHVFAGKTLVEVCAQHLSEAPMPPSTRVQGVPEALERILLDCLAKDPALRPQSATELQKRLLAIDHLENWDAARAKAWWTAHETALRARRSAGRSGQRQTLEVDFAGRS